MHWTADGNAYVTGTQGDLALTDIRTGTKTVLIPQDKLRAPGNNQRLSISDFVFTPDSANVLIFTNTARVWRYNTRGDYYLINRASGLVRQVGKERPAQSLMFAKLSPNGRAVAYVSEHNLFVEDVATGQVTQLTTDGTRKRINGTFDWVYEEEFGCRDGFRWSPDSKQIAYWQVDATKIRDYLMLNTTDSVYSHVIPVEYPKVGEAPSPTRIGVVSATGGPTVWLAIPGDPQQYYLNRMDWIPSSGNLFVQQLNRKQNESKLFVCNTGTQSITPIYTETDKAWVDVRVRNSNDPDGEWLNGGKAFVWVSEKDGWRHIYRVGIDGKGETLLTPGSYDIESVSHIDEATNQIYFIASPQNTNQRYLYRTRLDGKGKAERLTPAGLDGSHSYVISPNGKLAQHTFTNYQTPSVQEWISLPDHKPVNASESIASRMKPVTKSNVSFFNVTTEDGVTVDGWMAKPTNFDSTKKYPIVFYVYGEPASSTVNDVFSIGQNRLFQGDMANAGYLYVALDNRGTPNLKGAAWRKSIYRQIGRINIRDQAMAAKKLFTQHAFIDTSRVAVWGWSGGGSTTLHLLFQYPEIYKTGISVAAVGNQLFYDNIYQERYMGLPQENREDFVAGSPVTYAKNLRGNLLYIHGTGDDNVHYDNAELLINELVKYNKQFQVMPYPNRSHGISEGEGTQQHLRTLYTTYLRTHCPPGPR
ncbi:prolyl oligopeptidase family serine peptidase [Spirosoma sp. HMF4905]|uniref:Prolyl oligopeptidase family serine peptidase n=1 Tax=Spirosoma arboris TaxID=2682092 RepID=A0A7K1SKT4_9BACT|nr:S9 family peptidase [Spirosoma arboris]MVM34303.1 prolyl oligopeptidase family serine peptidase [Spirosoma arboris]